MRVRFVGGSMREVQSPPGLKQLSGVAEPLRTAGQGWWPCCLQATARAGPAGGPSGRSGSGQLASWQLAAGGGSGGVLAWYLVGRGANQSGGLCGVWAPRAHCHLEQELPQLCRSSAAPGHAWREVWTRQDIHLGATPGCAAFRRNQQSNDQFSSGVADGRAHCRTATRLWFPGQVYNRRASCG